MVNISFALADKNADMLGLSELLARFPLAEVFIPLSEKNSSFSSPGWSWLSSLVCFINSKGLSVNMSLSIEGVWSKMFCQGLEIKEIISLLEMKDCNGNLFFKRVMLDLPACLCKNKYVAKLAGIIKQYPHHRFVLPCNKDTMYIIPELYRRHDISFDLIYDTEDAISGDTFEYELPFYPDIVQGYSGNLIPDNVKSRLNVIKEFLLREKNSAGAFIYAKYGLQNRDGMFDFIKCVKYLSRAMH